MMHNLFVYSSGRLLFEISEELCQSLSLGTSARWCRVYTSCFTQLVDWWREVASYPLQ